MDKIKELRSVKAAYRIDASGDKPLTIVGTAVVWDSPSDGNLIGFTEIIRRGAFSRSIKENDILALYSHNSSNLLGRTSSGTLKLTEDDEGLQFELSLPDTQLGHDVAELISRGDLRGMSFGFCSDHAGADRWSTDSNGMPLRELLDVNCFEISIVAQPVYEDTHVSLRSFEAFKASQVPARKYKYLPMVKIKLAELA